MDTFELSVATWETLNRLLDQALDLPEPERDAWLDRLPPEHRRHADRLRELLSGVKLASPLDALPRLAPASPDDPRPLDQPAEVGPYRLIRPLGEGGMGSVWLAVRKDLMLRRPVALKLPRVSWRGSALARRLAREREILSSLDHPHIAKLLDAGVTEDGQPYLALEYVEGRPIDLYVREARLSLRARLELFLQIASAVAHAHARLVVHRDLKPSNILVTEDGQVRLLDFGIATLLEGEAAPESELTQQAGQAFTPNYAAPEQLAGQPMGVAADSYSLGVVLYELVAQTPPYRLRRESGSLHEALRSVHIAKPSETAEDRSLRRALAGDVDTIVLKSLRFSAEERYPTVDAFAADVSRYLGGFPIHARPESTAYRLRKLIQRNRIAAVAAAAVGLAVVGGASTALWQARIARGEQRRAEEVKDFIAGIFQEANPYREQGRPLSGVELLKQAHARIDRIGHGSPALRVELLNLLGSSLLGLGDADGGEAVARQALEEASRSLPPDHVQHLRARLLATDVHLARGRGREMQAEMALLIPELERGVREHPADLVHALENRASMAIEEVRQADALRDARAAFDLALARLGDRDPRTASAAVLLAESHMYGAPGPAEELQAAERALHFNLRAYADQPRHPNVIAARDVYGRALCHAGQPDRALEELAVALRDARQVLGPSSPLVGVISMNRVPCERRLGYIREALADATRGMEIRASSMQRESRSWGNTHAVRGATLLLAGRGSEALEELTPAVDALTRALGPRHRVTLTARAQRMLALASLGRSAEARAELLALESDREAMPALLLYDHLAGSTLRRMGDAAAAVEAQRKALAAIPADPQARWNRLRIVTELGLAEVELGHHAQAQAALEEALALSAVEQREDSPLRADAWLGLGRALGGQDRDADALVYFQRADAFWSAFDERNRAAGEAARWLGRCYTRLGRRAEGERALFRARSILSASQE